MKCIRPAMSANTHFLRSFTVVSFVLLLAGFPLAAQNEPSGGDTPLKPGEAVILGQQSPPPRQQSERDRETYVRAVILPMNTPSGPVRIRFERAVDLDRWRSSQRSLRMSVSSYSRGRLQGEWTWQNENELRFVPERGSVRLGDYLQVDVYGTVPLRGSKDPRQVSVSSGFQVEDFVMGSKAARRPVTPGNPRFVAFLTSGTGKVGRGPLHVLYDQVVDPAGFVSAFSATCNGEALTVQVRRPKSLSFDPDGDYDTSHIIAVSFDPLPPDGSVITLRYPASVEESGIELSAEEFVVLTDFNWISPDLYELKAGRAARLSSDWRITFTTPTDSSRFVSAFSISPRPPVLDVSFSARDSDIYIHAEFDVGRRYSIKLSPGFTDLLGNTLAEPLSFSFKSQDLSPVLTLPQFPLLLETGSNRLPVKFRNLKDIRIAAFRYAGAASFIQTLASNNPAGGSAEQRAPITVQQSNDLMNILYQADFGIGMEPGLKRLEVRAQGTGSEGGFPLSQSILAQTTNLAVSAKVFDGGVFAWVTRIDSAVPVSGAKVELFNARGTSRGSALTLANGTARIKAAEARGSELDQPLYLAASMGKDISICRLSNEELSGAWQFNLPGSVRDANPLAAALFTERGAYRPGETVHVKAFIRDLPEYADAPDPVLVVHDPRGQEAFRGSVKLDAYRGCSWDFPVKQGAAVGGYSANLMLGRFVATTSFRVEEYRAPTFQVILTSPQGSWHIDDPVTVKAVASYLKGGRLGGRPATWRVYSQPEVFAVSGFPGYLFTPEQDLTAAGTVIDEPGILDVDGEATLSFTPSHPDSSGPMLYIAQASVTDSDRQNYAGRISRIVHATDLYVGVRPPPRVIYPSGDTLSFPYIVTDTDGKVVSGQAVDIFLDTLEYNQNTMLDDAGRAATYNREVVSSVRLASPQSGEAPQDYSVPLVAAGRYRIRLESRDRNGHLASTAFTVTVSGKGTVAWPRFDRERIDLVLDRKSYKAGDRATVVAQAPFTAARGLLTVEANGVFDSFPFVINKNTPAVSFPVKASYAPNAFVSVIILRGRVHYAKDATGFETGAPAYRVGYARLEVDPSAQKLRVSLDQKSLTASPAQQVKLSFSLKDASGKPTDASAAVMVVDEGVLALTGFKTPDPVALAYVFRVLGVRNASNLLDLPHARRARYETLFPPGDSDASAKLPPSDDVLRALFKSTAYYNPAVPVGANGRAAVLFKLPDNLTTYRVMIVAANKAGLMGSTQGALRVSKPLVVEPVAPRFVYEGDQLTVQARVFNNTDADGTVVISASFKGLEPADTLAPARLDVKKGDYALVSYPVVARPGVEKAVLTFTARMGSARDAVEWPIPVRARENRMVSVQNGIISGSSSLRLALPRHTPGNVEVVLSQTALSELKDSVQYLMQYPNGCIEQTTSTAYPLVVLKDLLPAIGVQVSAAELKAFSEAGVARILSFQTRQGGLSYWPGGDQPHAFATAFGLTALIEAKKRGYNVPDAALKGMGDYLAESLASGRITGEMPHGGMADADTRALFVMTLGRLGRPQPAHIAALWQAREALTPFGLAFLAIAVKESKGDQSLLQPILAAIKAASTEKKDEAFFDGKPKGGWSLDSPIRTHAGSLVAYAVAGTDPQMPQKLLKGLLTRRRGGLWGNTQENVFGIMGVYQLVAGSAGGGGEATPKGLTVTLNGKSYPASAFEKNSMGVLRLSLPETAIGGTEDGITADVDGPSGASFYVTLRASYEVPVEEWSQEPTSNGFTYSRSYETMEGESLEGQTIPLGSLVKVRLRVSHDKSRHYVAVEDLLPAGFEPLNTSFATTESVDMGQVSDVALKSQSVISYSEMRDHRVAFYADELSPGGYEFVYLARATTPGTFYQPSARAEAMYAPSENGTTGGGSVTVR